MSIKLKLMGVDVVSIGDVYGMMVGSCIYQYVDECCQVYKKLVVFDCGKFLYGVVMVGDVVEYGMLLQMMLNCIELFELLEFLILLLLDGVVKLVIGVDVLLEGV